MGTAYNIRKTCLEAPQLYKPRLFFERKKKKLKLTLLWKAINRIKINMVVIL